MMWKTDKTETTEGFDKTLILPALMRDTNLETLTL